MTPSAPSGVLDGIFGIAIQCLTAEAAYAVSFVLGLEAGLSTAEAADAAGLPLFAARLLIKNLTILLLPSVNHINVWSLGHCLLSFACCSALSIVLPTIGDYRLAVFGVLVSNARSETGELNPDYSEKSKRLSFVGHPLARPTQILLQGEAFLSAWRFYGRLYDVVTLFSSAS